MVSAARVSDPNSSSRPTMTLKPGVMVEARRGSSLRKLVPKAELPIPSQLAKFSAEEIETLTQHLDPTIELECIYHESFPRVNAERKLLGPLDEIDDQETVALGGDYDIPAASSTKTLSAAEEQELFLCFNYCRYRAMRLIRDAGGARLTARQARDLLRWHQRAVVTRTHIIQANLSLVPAMAKRTKTTGVDLGDLVCEGNLALLRSVDKFDCSRGFKFSTYACRAILSSFSSSASKSSRYRSLFPTEFDPALERSDYLEKRRAEQELESVRELRTILDQNHANLSGVERKVLEARFDLLRDPFAPGGPESKTLKQVAELIGVTKERVRQIQNRALDKLRSAMDSDVAAA